MLASVGFTLIAVCLAFLYYIYDGYGRLLSILASQKCGPSRKAVENAGELNDDISLWPSVSVILPVFNEEPRVVTKLRNILAQDYPRDKLEIVVVSDGSTDKTDDLVAEFAEQGVRLFKTPGRYGKSLAQNEALGVASGDILVLTDAAVEMDEACIRELVRPFSDQEVGCVTGALQFRNMGDSDVAQDQGYYWQYELKLRELESRLGWLAVAAGPLMAVRRDLWVPLQSWYGDDCVIPLDVILQGKRVVHSASAVGWDESFNTLKQEFRARVRMTVRNLHGTFARRSLLNFLRYPHYAFALWSHKIIRWCSPVFLCGIGFGVLLLWLGGGGMTLISFFMISMLLGTVGVISVLLGKKVAMLGTLGNFLVVNVAFALGLYRAVKGRRIDIYQNK